MPGIEDAFERLADDPAFADAVRLDPVGALTPFGLTVDELARVQRLVDPDQWSSRPLFDIPPDAH